jgi:hypothetical protein
MSAVPSDLELKDVQRRPERGLLALRSGGGDEPRLIEIDA